MFSLPDLPLSATTFIGNSQRLKYESRICKNTLTIDGLITITERDTKSIGKCIQGQLWQRELKSEFLFNFPLYLSSRIEETFVMNVVRNEDLTTATVSIVIKTLVGNCLTQNISYLTLPDAFSLKDRSN